MRVLLVDDDKKFTTGLKIFLNKFSIIVTIEDCISSAEKQLKKSNFDVILLDVMMPGGSGFDFLPTIRRICDIPVIMLTALDEEDELVTGLDLGADDYITKPFSPNELVARIRAIHRRYSNGKTNNQSILDDLELFHSQCMVRVGSININLTEAESLIIHLLLNAKDNYLTREFLYH